MLQYGYDHCFAIERELLSKWIQLRTFWSDALIDILVLTDHVVNIHEWPFHLLFLRNSQASCEDGVIVLVTKNVFVGLPIVEYDCHVQKENSSEPLWSFKSDG